MKIARTVGTIAAALMLAATSLFAETLAEIKTRMKERLPAIEQMKSASVVGENNKGFLEFVGTQKDAEKEAVLTAENADRQAVYAALAAQTGATPESVGMRRALQIRKDAKPGTWVQNEKGAWVEVK